MKKYIRLYGLDYFCEWAQTAMCNQNYDDGAALFSHVPCTLWSWTALMDPVVFSFSSGLIIIVH